MPAPDLSRLHDAMISVITMNWPAKLVHLSLVAFLEPEENAVPCTIEFSGVKDLRVPHTESWGPSIYINKAERNGERWLIEMQSGDVIAIEAEECNLRR